MLVLCYGITKSGSTLAFEMVKGVLASAGYAQDRLPDSLIDAKHRVNYIEPLDIERIATLLAAIGPERRIAVKTHANFGTRACPDTRLLPWLDEMRARGHLQVIASYRDPRDICLSLVDAGAKARARGEREFSEITDIGSAIQKVEHQLRYFRKWASVEGALRLNYDLVAFSPEEAIGRIERSLGVTCDHEAVKTYAFQEAFTQKNKATRSRFRNELGRDQKQELRKAFGSFIRDVCRNDDECWFSSYRGQIYSKLAGLKAADPNAA